ncbi:MAG: T9SS type A sorting domain-containing protein, partial [Prolixibacteraceae bacterium]|nr:T9SS type A sorting domain-containing protein [Prolixibacteraceae bacterium]
AVASGSVAVTSTTTNLTFSTDGINYAAYTAPFVVSAGSNYSITAKNLSGCVSIAATGTMGAALTAPDQPTVQLTQPTCAVASGSVAVTSTTTNLTFSIDGTTYTTGIFSGLTPGDYYVTAKNEVGCVSAQSAKLTIAAQPETPLAPTATMIQPTCTVATGTITVSSSLTGLTFSIDGTTYTNTTGIFSGLTPGDYYVTAKNEAGCVSAQSAKQTIAAQPEAPTVISPSVAPSLVVGSGQVVFTASASAGTIKWFDSATGGLEVFVLNPTISSTTTYYAEAISSAGCVSASRTAVTATVIPQGDEELSYRFANPRIHKVGGLDHFEFDVQVKASEAGTSFWAGNVNLDFNTSTLSADVTNWVVTSGLSFTGKYTTELTINGSVLNLDIKTPANATDFTAITTAYQTMATLSGKITSSTGVTGIDFNEVNMNGKQFYKLATDPGYAAYKNQNAYDVADFVDTYVGRVYAVKYGWTQIVGLNWNAAVNTSVWEGDALVPVANASNLRIHKPGTLTLPSDAELTVSGNTDIKPVNGLILESDAAGTGSLITGTATGTATVQRYMTTDAWHIVSSPVSGQSISGFLSANATIAVSQDDSFRGMMDYNPDLNEWNAYFTNATGGNLATGKGYSLRTSANSAVSFSGNIHAGNLSPTSLISEKWNCIGNPYTSALEINGSSSSFLTENVSHFDPSYGAIYVWDQPDESNGQYGKYTVISNASPGFEVQQGQAYLVKMKTGSTSVDFNPGMQIHNSALALKSAKSVWPIIKLQASVNSQKSSTVITFGNGMTKGLDPTFDAGLLKGGSDLIVYTKLVEDNGIPFAIQALPMNDLSSMVIPVGLDFKTGGEVVFSSEQMSLPSDCKVILEDKELKTFTDLSMTVYKTKVAAKSVLTERFVLHVSSLKTGLDVNDQNDELSAYAVRNVEMRVVGEVSNRAVASVYDIQGRLVVTERLSAGSMNTVKLPSVKTGIYLLFVKDGENLQRFKLPVTE